MEFSLQAMEILETKADRAIYDSSYIFLYTHISHTCTTIFLEVAVSPAISEIV